ncbi:MAG TPA: hypothetical protein VK426_01055 [Methanobacterium sp.]|nr:hypothetical protein [Methanobacterium sp.]
MNSNMKRITEKRWFGPKIVGYGPAPKSWEGWVVTIVWWISLAFSIFYLHSINSLTIVNIAIVIILAAIILLTVAALTYGSDEDQK